MKVLCFVVLLSAAAVLATPHSQVPRRFLLDILTGSTAANFESRIIDGETVTADASAPYIVSLGISKLAHAHACAGTIIGKEWVLTAAHCLTDIKQMTGAVEGLPVYAGISNRAQIDDAQVTYIDFAFSHKQFNGQTDSDDIALLHVSPPFEFSDKVRSAFLPYVDEDFGGVETAAYGWGLDNPEGELFVKNLRVARSNVLTASECINAITADVALGSKQVCAHITACYGDGGSPLVKEFAGGFAELVGITSWGYLPCGYNGRPTVFTSVAKYIAWINEVQFAYNVLH